jgi:hypothetical protein
MVMIMLLDEEIFCYIGKRVEFDNVLPSIDDIYTEFQNAFEILGFDTDVIEKMIDSYVSCSDINGVQIEWEGDLSEFGIGRIDKSAAIPFKTA